MLRYGIGALRRVQRAASTVPQCTSVQPRRFYESMIMRELRRKTQAVPSIHANLDDGDEIVFPRERLGLDYDLNWSINACGVTPTNEAFRNLHRRALVQRAACRVDKEHDALLFDRSAAAVSKPQAELKWLNAEQVETDAYKRLLKEVRRDHMSQRDALFVHDGAVGTHTRDEYRVRVIADNAATALFARDLLAPTHLRAATSFGEQLTVLVAADYTGGDGDFATPFALIDERQRLLIVAGTPSFSALRDAVARAATAHFTRAFGLDAEQEAGDSAGARVCVPLKCDSVAHDGRLVLVFNAPASVKGAGYRGATFGADYNLWSEDGVLAYFRSQTLDASNAPGLKPKSGSLVEQYASQSLISDRSGRSASSNALAPPIALVFFSETPGGATVAEVSAADAAAQCAQGDAQRKAVARLLNAHSPKCYALNTASAKGQRAPSVSSIEKIMVDIVSGKSPM